MSRFFRSATSTSSSDTDSSSGSGDELGELTNDLSASRHAVEAADIVSSIEGTTPSAIAGEEATSDKPSLNTGNVSKNRQATTDHRDILLHALLEERCLNETLASHGNLLESRESPEVQAQARAKYQRISTQLASLNLISSGLANDNHAKTRQTYRTGLDFLSRNTTAAGPSRLRRLLTDSEAELGARRLTERETPAENARDVAHRPPALPYPLRRLITGTDTVEEQRQVDQNKPAALVFQHHKHTIPETISNSTAAIARNDFEQPRYVRDFEELGMLGKGGYGIVYRARHRVDNQSYAIKKVPLSAAQLGRIQARGQSEVDEVLCELRTLAQLDHPNIVRYHTSWIEWTNNQSIARLSQSSVDSGVLSTASEEAVLGAQDDREPDVSAKLATTSRSEHVDIVFESSACGSDQAMPEADPSTDLNSLPVEPVSVGTSTRNNGATKRAISPINIVAGTGSTSNQSANDSTLVLHMQMSLHPMSLAEYLAPVQASSNPDAPPPLSHCFHLEPSMSILQAILNGMEYLHDKGMIHRDIKPANIFIGTTTGSGSTHDLTCSHCRTQRKATPVPLDIRIGDFGLVALGHSTQAFPTKSTVVGTELYRSTGAGVSNSQLDIYALGIVAFELLWQFNTRMERLYVIKQLKEGQFPEGFSDRLGTHGESVTKCIRSMISPNGTSLSIRGIKQVLADLQKTFH